MTWPFALLACAGRGWPRASARARISNYDMAVTTTYGPLEAWFVDGRRSIGEIADLKSPSRRGPGSTPNGTGTPLPMPPTEIPPIPLLTPSSDEPPPRTSDGNRSARP
jgi:hypothetical protein